MCDHKVHRTELIKSTEDSQEWMCPEPQCMYHCRTGGKDGFKIINYGKDQWNTRHYGATEGLGLEGLKMKVKNG